ncbi:TIR domain-containing protein [Halomonas sp. M4R1S46]|uniref:TIR domain-containing protein n=1 Tax=Halomonas sp. M4R1S46 TaxID=2982692 RepID=UPI0021E49F17|nr:TIR domain-containing protein [Halomonas sp. M4R1S46]UYG07163.1 TIR domain-containing protein [Halomonas sp. M4R1S46]
MGGSSGGGWNRLGDIRALEEKARAALQGGKRNVFISFATEDMDEVNLLRAHAKNENSDIEFSDHSVRKPYDSEQAEYIRRKIGERIARSSTTVVYISENTVQSRWVSWEVQKSLELGKRVIAVHPGEGFEGRKPDWLAGNIKIVPWAKLADELK